MTWDDHWRAFRDATQSLPAKELEDAWVKYATKHNLPLRRPREDQAEAGTEPAQKPRRGRPPKAATSGT